MNIREGRRSAQRAIQLAAFAPLVAGFGAFIAWGLWRSRLEAPYARCPGRPDCLFRSDQVIPWLFVSAALIASALFLFSRERSTRQKVIAAGLAVVFIGSLIGASLTPWGFVS